MRRVVSGMSILVGLILTVPAAAADVNTAKLVGTATDEAGKPLAGVTVLINRTQGGQINFDQAMIQGTTDAKGRYELTLKFAEPSQLRTRLWATAKGCIRAEPEQVLDLKDGATFTMNVKMIRGEPLAGTVRIPPTALEPRPDQEQSLFWVEGPKFRQFFLTEKGGKFEVFVPPGEYTVWSKHDGGKLELKGVKAGTTGLVLAPKPFVWTEENVGKAFDQLWEVMDRHYSYFTIKKDVDWKALKETYRPRAAKAKDAKELAAALKEMLAHLKDLHVWIQTPDGQVHPYGNPYLGNRNVNVVLAQLEDRTECGPFAIVGKTRGDGFGYFLMTRQSAADADNFGKAIAAIEKLKGAPGFIVDLRSANGGDERKAAQIARLFCGKKTVYAKSKYRGGPGHGDFGQEYERVLEPSERPFLKPVVCLIGPGAVSSGEGFVKMLQCLPNVTTVGMPTRGASGNPQPIDLPGTGLAVWFSRWVDLMPDGKTFEGTGIPPAVVVDLPPDRYAKSDPTLEKGLEILKAKVAKAGPP